MNEELIINLTVSLVAIAILLIFIFCGHIKYKRKKAFIDGYMQGAYDNSLWPWTDEFEKELRWYAEENYKIQYE